MFSKLPPFMTSLCDFASQKEKSDPLIRQLSTIDLIVQPDASERRFTYDIRMAYVHGQGCAYSERGSDYRGDEFVGKGVFESFQYLDHVTRVAVIDGVFAAYKKEPSDRIVLKGNINEKSCQRPAFYTKNIISKLNGINKPKILMVGLVKSILFDLLLNNCEVYVTDLDAQAQFDAKEQSTQSANINFIPPSAICSVINDIDMVLATGMIFANNTFHDISDMCSSKSVPLTIFAETGANIAPFLIGHGVDYVIAEYFPFFVFGGESTIDFFDKDHRF